MNMETIDNVIEFDQKEPVLSKKEMILSLFENGTTEVETIAAISGARPSYVGSVLHEAGLIDNYFDLYTSTNHPMNVYSKHFRGKLGFKDVETARRSVRNLEEAYRYFEKQQDRAGQHHALEMGLTMLDRARWTGKLEEAEVYRLWIVNKLSRPLVDNVKSLEEKRQEKQREAEQAELKFAA
ncbi:MAG: hypothetical protein JSS81_05470 [Acidobacteria bacterium]|nr:hypothetical protein [Acidobacteriota bacterium]